MNNNNAGGPNIDVFEAEKRERLKANAQRLAEGRKGRNKARSKRVLGTKEIVGIALASLAVIGYLCYVTYRQDQSMKNYQPEPTMWVDESGYAHFTEEQTQQMKEDYDEWMKSITPQDTEDSKGMGGK